MIGRESRQDGWDSFRCLTAVCLSLPRIWRTDGTAFAPELQRDRLIHGLLHFRFEGIMWRTQTGERVLCGAEARLIQTALGVLVDQIEMDIEFSDQSDFGVPVFDRLEARQKLALLADVCDHLLRSTEPPPQLTATNESAIAVLYAVIEDFVRAEVEAEDDVRGMPDGDPFGWRRRLLDAYQESLPDVQDAPTESCRDMEDWIPLIECLQDLVLWDADYLDEGLYADQSPDVGRFLKAQMGVPADYFQAVAPDPADCDLPNIRQRLRSLIRD
jgi:hypothetical protein